MTIFTVQGSDDTPLIMILLAEVEADQAKFASLSNDLKPFITPPIENIKAEGEEVIAIASALVGVLQQFIAWKKVQTYVNERKEHLAQASTPSQAAEEDPFANIKELDQSQMFGDES